MALSIAENPPECFLPGALFPRESESPREDPEAFGSGGGSVAQMVASITRVSPGWMAVQTAYRREKQFASFLEFHGIPYFLPYSRSWASSPENPVRTTRNRILVPMFDGFVFMAARMAAENDLRSGPSGRSTSTYSFSPDLRWKSPSALTEEERDYLFSDTKDIAYGSGLVFRILTSKNQPRFAAELLQLASLSVEERSLASGMGTPLEGDPVEVQAGPFQGMVGHISKNPTHTWSEKVQCYFVKMVVDLHLLGRHVSVEIDADLLQRVPD